MSAGTTAPRAANLAGRFAESLERAGFDLVCGVPGGLIHGFFEEVERSASLRLIVTKHEEGAAFVADGYARSTGRPAICAATSGPGATNLMTGVAVAHADGVPMLVLTGQAPSTALGKGASQETGRSGIDIVGMFRTISRYSAMVESPGRLEHHLAAALRAMRSGRPGPVHLNVPVDFWNADVPVREEVFVETPPPRTFDPERVRAAAEAISRAEAPTLLAGGGLIQDAAARSALFELAERHGLPVATTPRGKGVFPEDHPLSLGVIGFGGQDRARDRLLRPGACDLLFAVGASLNETTTFNWHPQFASGAQLVHCDIDPERIGRNYPTDIGLIGDAGAVLQSIAQQLKSIGPVPTVSAENRASPHRPPNLPGDPETAAPGFAHPAEWRAELNDVLPEECIVFSDIGGHMLFNISHLRIRRKQKFLLNLGFGSMGHGTVAPLGAQLAHPDRPVVAIVGDACFSMNGMELLTAREYDLPVVWIVENNQMHGITWHGSQAVSEGRAMDAVVYRKPLRVGAIAAAMGIATSTVDGPGQLAPALRAAFASGAPHLVDIRTDPDIAPPLGDRADTISGFKGSASA